MGKDAAEFAGERDSCQSARYDEWNNVCFIGESGAGRAHGGDRDTLRKGHRNGDEMGQLRA